MHAIAKVNGIIIAETDSYEVVEGNVYFPPASLKKEYFKETDTHTICGWKGTASYYTINVGGSDVKNAAWYYQDPYEKAKHIKDHVAFCMNSYLRKS
jgi:uncharacterized protein (DUF427 family)